MVLPADDLSGPRHRCRSRASWWRASSPAAIARRTSKDSVRPGGFEGVGSAGEGGVEVEGVGQVELSFEVGGAVEGDLVVVEGHVPALGRVLGVLGCVVGHVPGDRLGDEPVELGGADLVRERRDLGVHEPRGLGCEAEGGLGDPACPPHRNLTVLHPGPVPPEAVLQLDRVGEVGASGVGGAADRERELREGELRDQRCTRTGQGEAGVTTTGDPGRREVDRLRWVLLGPGQLAVSGLDYPLASLAARPPSLGRSLLNGPVRREPAKSKPIGGRAASAASDQSRPRTESQEAVPTTALGTARVGVPELEQAAAATGYRSCVVVLLATSQTAQEGPR